MKTTFRNSKPFLIFYQKRPLALILSRKLLWWHQIMCDSFSRVLHLSQDLIPDYSLTCWTSSQRQKITLLPFPERIRNQKFEIHWLTKSVCIHYSNVSIALMLFKNHLIIKFHLSDWIGYKFWMFCKKCCKVIFCKWEFVK